MRSTRISGCISNFLSDIHTILTVAIVFYIFYVILILTTMKPPSVTICITVRDERNNIEPIAISLPRVTKIQEIIFVEGHSQDGTREEIGRVITKYPQKNIRLLIQKGMGQADAIKQGFSGAKGDIVILYEGDGTSEPHDIREMYKTLVQKKNHFVVGNRFAYPLPKYAMPFLNRTGNYFFAKWVSHMLEQKIPDVLSGIKGMYTTDFKKLEKHWGFLGIEDPFGDFELLFGAKRLGLSISEIPMHYYPRVYGTTKTKPFFHGKFLLAMGIKAEVYFRKKHLK